MYRIVIMLFCLFISVSSRSQIWPKEDKVLNYRLVGFSFPAESQAVKYTIEIAAGHHTTTDSFVKNIVVSVNDTRNKIIGEVPAFGSQYTWRIVYTGRKKVIKKSVLYHFSTVMNLRVDTTKLHLRLLQAAQSHAGDYVAVDAGGVIYDMTGHPVWCVPEIEGISGYVADLKFTPQGTITFIYKNAYEINYDGDILWKAPNTGIVSGDTKNPNGEFYHHEFTRLSNGHYMVLGIQMVPIKSVSAKDSSYLLVSNDKSEPGYGLGRFGTIIEYDDKGNIVWSWRSSKYLIGSDFDYYESRVDSNKRYDAHDNGFYFDEKNKTIYVSFRNLNRIMKIAYPGGQVLNSYGENFKPGAGGIGKGLFCNQHSIDRSMDGYLYYFNNNSCMLRDSLPTVVMIHEPVSGDDSIKKVWEYVCPVEAGVPRRFGNGGNVIELPDSTLFVNLGSEYSKLFIVNRKKKILWSALPERFMEPDQKWTPIKEYRANIISRKGLEQLIWTSELSSPEKVK